MSDEIYCPVSSLYSPQMYYLSVSIFQYSMGYLNMKGDKIKKWTQMYIVFKNSILYYYNNNTAKEPKGIIGLDDASIGASGTVEGRDNVFEVITRTGRGFYFQPQSASEQNEWIRALNNQSYTAIHRQVEELDNGLKQLALDQAMTMEQNLKDKEYIKTLENNLSAYKNAAPVIRIVELQKVFLKRVMIRSFHTWLNNADVITTNKIIDGINEEHQQQQNQLQSEIQSKVEEIQKLNENHKNELDEMEKSFNSFKQEMEEKNKEEMNQLELKYKMQIEEEKNTSKQQLNQLGLILLNKIAISIKSRQLLRHFEKWNFITHIPRYHVEISKLKECVTSIENLYKEKMNEVIKNRDEIIDSVINSYDETINELKKHCEISIQTALASTNAAKQLLKSSDNNNNANCMALEKINEELIKISEYYNNHNPSNISIDQLYEQIHTLENEIKRLSNTVEEKDQSINQSKINEIDNKKDEEIMNLRNELNKVKTEDHVNESFKKELEELKKKFDEMVNESVEIKKKLETAENKLKLVENPH